MSWGYYEDIASDTRIGVPIGTDKHIFGGAEADTIEGGIGKDHLYGGIGNDILTGNGDDDYLEGGSGNDTYIYNQGDGYDTILDTDGQGSIVYDGVTLTGGSQYGAVGTYRDAGKHLYVLTGQDLLIDGNILVKNFQDGDLGISLTGPDENPPGDPETGNDIIGDLAPLDLDPDAEGVQIGYDDLGNVITGSEAEPDRADTLRGSEGNDHIMGKGGNDRIIGGLGDDLIEAGTGQDSVWGCVGNDTIRGGAGDDILADGDSGFGIMAGGDDVIMGDEGRDMVKGEGGNDSLSGGADSDIVLGGEGDDRLYGEAQISAADAIANGDTEAGTGMKGDWLSGGAGDDILAGNAGNDVLMGGDGQDLLIGGAGDDDIMGDGDLEAGTLEWSGTDPNDSSSTKYNSLVQFVSVLTAPGYGTDVIYAGAGNDNVWGGRANDMLFGGDGNDLLYGGDGNRIDRLGGNDTLLGGAGEDALWGEMGDDVLNGGAGNDSLDGGEGSDTYRFDPEWGQDRIFDYDTNAGNQDAIRFAAGILADDITVSREGDNLILSRPGTTDTLKVLFYFNSDTGNPYQIEAIEFDDGTVWDLDAVNAKLVPVDPPGGGIDDILYGTVMADSLDGLGGNDTILGRGGNDTLSGGADNDLVYGEGGSDVLDGGTGNDEMYGGNDNDILYGGDGDDILYGGTVMLENTGNDLLDGGAGDDRLYGMDGDDTLNGGVGNDILSGQDGSDTYLFGLGSGQDVIDNNYGARNQDVIQLASGILATDILISRSGDTLILSITGTADTLSIGAYFSYPGANAVEEIHFADGTIWDERIIRTMGTAGDDVLIGDDAENTIDGLGGNDTIWGRDGNDILKGGADNDTIYGEEGDDVLDGGMGNDFLSGGAGSDIFLFNLGLGQDVIAADDTSVGKLDAILFAADVLPSDIKVSRDTVNLILSISGTTDRLTVIRYFESDGTSVYPIQEIRFADGTVWDVDTVKAMALGGTNGDDYLVGYDTADTIDGLAGNDNIWGQDGNDILDGGADRDQLWGGHDDDKIDGGADADTLRGGYGDDILYGGTGDDLLFGWGGDDHYDPLLPSGNDVLNGGAGNDQLNGDDGDDVLNGGTGNDYLRGGEGSDTYLLGRGSGWDWLDNYNYDLSVTKLDVIQFASDIAPDDIHILNNANNLWLYIGARVDILSVFGYFVNDGVNAWTVEEIHFADGTVWDIDTVKARALMGTSEVDQLIGYATADTINSLAGNDFINGKGGNDILNGGSDNDYVSGDNGDDSVVGGTGHDGLSGGNGNDVLIGGEGDDVISGNDGDDLLDGGTGQDQMEGGKGNDIYVVDNGFDGETEAFDEGIDSVQSSITYDLRTNVENLTLTGTEAINGTGNTLDNVLVGNSAANRLTGGAGTDTLIGKAGNDLYIVDNNLDVITEALNEGVDSIQSGISYTLADNVENLILTGAAAINGTGNTGNNSLTGNSAANILDGAAGADTLIGGAGNDTYIVDNSLDVVIEAYNDNADTIWSGIAYTLAANVENLTLTGATAIDGTGNLLNNVLTGNGAGSTLAGDAGDDTYIIGIGDRVVEGRNKGTDTVRSDMTFTLGKNIENLILTGEAAIDGTGNSLNNVLTGNDADNILAGEAGDDTYVIGTGDSVVEARNKGADTVQSGDSYALGKNIENLTLTGTADINGTGNSLDNVLIGNSNANTLNGGVGNDQLNGGAGADNFVFDSALDASANNDTIGDFSVMEDTIRLENAIFTRFSTTGALAAGNFVSGAGAIALDSNDYLIYDTTDGHLYYDADGSGAGGHVAFVSLTGRPALAATDFAVI